MIRRLIGRWSVNRHMKRNGHTFTAMPDPYGRSCRLHVYCNGCPAEWVI